MLFGEKRPATPPDETGTDTIYPALRRRKKLGQTQLIPLYPRARRKPHHKSFAETSPYPVLEGKGDAAAASRFHP